VDLASIYLLGVR